MSGRCHRSQLRMWDEAREADGVDEVRAERTPAVAEDLRAGDRDRDRVNAVLGDAYAKGYLTLPEFEQRSEQVLTARTLGELQPLTADLPNQHEAQREQRVEARRTAARQGVKAHVFSYVGAMVIMIGIWLFTALAFDATYFWPIWPALGWGIGVASHALPVLRSTAAPALPQGYALPRGQGPRPR